jgi:hypothetical protein
MHYISLVKPQLVHAVLECPDDDARKCRLAGLSLGGSAVPIAKWHGSTSVVTDAESRSEVDENFTRELIQTGKWAHAYSRYRSLVQELKSAPRGKGKFAGLTAEQRRKLRQEADKLDTDWRKRMVHFKRELLINVRQLAESGQDDAAEDSYIFGGLTERTSRAENKIPAAEARARLELHGHRMFYRNDNDERADARFAQRAHAAAPNLAANILAVHPTTRRQTNGPVQVIDQRDADITEIVALTKAPTGGNAREVSGQRASTANKTWSEIDASFVLTLNPKLLDSPLYLAELITNVHDDGKDARIKDYAYGGLFRYGLDLSHYMKYRTTRAELEKKLFMSPGGMARVVAFHRNAKELLHAVPKLTRTSYAYTAAALNARTIPGVFDGDHELLKSKSDKHRDAAALTLLMLIATGLAGAQINVANGILADPQDQNPLLTYFTGIQGWYDLAKEYQVPDIEGSSYTTDAQRKALKDSYYNAAEGESQSQSLAGTAETETSEADKTTLEWMDRLEKIFDDTTEAY